MCARSGRSFPGISRWHRAHKRLLASGGGQMACMPAMLGTVNSTAKERASQPLTARSGVTSRTGGAKADSRAVSSERGNGPG
jgi:hypothetical protein